LEELERVETSEATTSELEGVELTDVEADIVVTATRTTNGSPHIIKCMRTLGNGDGWDLLKLSW